jgi:general stress protein 26
MRQGGLSTVAFRMTEDEAWEFVAQAHTSIVTTLRKDGRPIAAAVWHVVSDHTLYVQTPTATMKLARIRNDDRAHVLVPEGRAWAELRAVSFEAKATIIGEAPVIARKIAEKYEPFQPPLGDLPGSVRSRYSRVVIVKFEACGPLRSFDNSALLGTRGRSAQA